MYKRWFRILSFFFKQKAAYGFSACLVGSEMCIGGSCLHTQPTAQLYLHAGYLTRTNSSLSGGEVILKSARQRRLQNDPPERAPKALVPCAYSAVYILNYR